MPSAPAASPIRKGIIASMAGSLLEWYDFGLFGYLAPILGQQFFPHDNPTAALIQTFAIFAAGYLMRPIGGIVLGRIGDRYGRTVALRWSIYLMAFPTTLIGLLPTYSQAGITATLLLCLMRLLQGLSTGGELMGAYIYLAEHAPPHRRGLWTAWVNTMNSFGFILGSAAAALVIHTLTPEQAGLWGWRVPFLLGSVLAIFGVLLRRGVPESESFLESASVQTPSTHFGSSIWHALRTHPRQIVLCILIAMPQTAGFYFVFVWYANWLSQLRDPPIPEAFAINTAALAISALIMPFWGWFSDRMARKWCLAAATLLLAACIPPLMGIAGHGGWMSVLLVQCGLAIALSLCAATIPAILTELFPTSIRYTSISLGYNAGVAVFGGLTPLVATWLLRETGSIMAGAVLTAALMGLTFLTALTLTDRTARPLPT